MKCREKLAIEHPESINNARLGGCDGCPGNYGYSNATLRNCPFGTPSKRNCKKCWDSEVVGHQETCQRLYDEQWKKMSELVEDAMKKHDRSILISFNPDTGLNMSVVPWPDADELYEMYQRGRITGNDFRMRMGLNPVKNPESFMKKDFLKQEFHMSER